MQQKLQSLKQKLGIKNSRGVTIWEVLIVIVLVIVIMTVFMNFENMSKAFRSSDTAKWTREVSNISSSISSDTNRDQYLYQISVESTNVVEPYKSKVLPPSVSAYEDVTSIIFEGTSISTPTRQLEFNLGTVSYTETSSAKPLINSSHQLVSSSGQLLNPTSSKIEGLSFLGSVGIAKFVNETLPDINENLFLGLFGGKGTQLGNDYLKAKDAGTSMPKVGGADSQESVKKIISTLVGTGQVDFIADRGSDRIVDLKLVDSNLVASNLDSKSELLDNTKYRLYWVTSIASKAEAITLMKSKLGFTDADEAMLSNYYDSLTKSIVPNSLVVMPASDSYIVYSETSDFTLYKFSVAD